jgi:hypothetical protein
MLVPNFTTVTAVDAKHILQLAMTWPTWRKWKPDIIKNPMLIFYEHTQVKPEQIHAVCNHPNLKLVPWPPEGVVFAGDDSSKWSNTQRHKMLAGFVYVPAEHIKTPYWLKLDTDAVATGMPEWIDPNWFVGEPAIISHPWGFTRPADQMLQLDAFIEKYWEKDSGPTSIFNGTKSLNLIPNPGEDRLCHKRIGSWCGFFHSDFNRICASVASYVLGSPQLPVASQDGYTFYMATRLNLGVVRTSMKKRGFQVWATMDNIRKAVKESMEK